MRPRVSASVVRAIGARQTAPLNAVTARGLAADLLAERERVKALREALTAYVERDCHSDLCMFNQVAGCICGYDYRDDAARVAARHGAGVDYIAAANRYAEWLHASVGTCDDHARAIVDAALNSRGPGRGEEVVVARGRYDDSSGYVFAKDGVGIDRHAARISTYPVNEMAQFNGQQIEIVARKVSP